MSDSFPHCITIDGVSCSYQELVERISERLKNISDGIYSNLHPLDSWILLFACILSNRSVVISPLKIEVVSEKVDSGLESFIKIEDLWERLLCSKSKIVLYTSGTTGRPKSVSHSMESLARGIVRSDKRASDRWITSYSPFHMSGIQMIFQSVANLNSVTFVGGLSGGIEQILKVIDECNSIACTPSFLRSLLPYLSKENRKNVKVLTFGGEKNDPLLVERAQAVFPNARIRTIYASTEFGSLFIGDGTTFNVRNWCKDLVSRSPDGELLVHKSLLGQRDGALEEGDWYHTGDIIEGDLSNFAFVGRKSDFISVGGYKVNPHKIEALAESVDGVVSAVAKARPNSLLGTVIVLEVTVLSSELEKIKQEIGDKLKMSLSTWERPSVIKIVDTHAQTESGKVKRL